MAKTVPSVMSRVRGIMRGSWEEDRTPQVLIPARAVVMTTASATTPKDEIMRRLKTVLRVTEFLGSLGSRSGRVRETTSHNIPVNNKMEPTVIDTGTKITATLLTIHSLATP